jgi:hypothetical protein
VVVLLILVVLSAPLEIYNRLLFDRFDRCCCRTVAVAVAVAVAAVAVAVAGTAADTD